VEGDSSFTIYTYRFESSTGRELTVAKIVVRGLSGGAREAICKQTGLLDGSS